MRGRRGEGNDVIYGEGGNDTIYGGAESDYIDGGPNEDTAYGGGGAGINHCSSVEHENECSGSGESVSQRTQKTKISAGLMVTSLPAHLLYQQAYMLGSTGADNVTVEYVPGATPHVKLKRGEGSAEFDISAEVQTPGCTYAANEVNCTLSKKPDSVLLAGLGGNDHLSVTGFESTASPVLLGGEGEDNLFGSGTTEDVIVDGDGAYHDELHGLKFDDALVNNEGTDTLEGGLGSDLLVSGAICEGDTLNGAEATSLDSPISA